jgi:hypothetical protein
VSVGGVDGNQLDGMALMPGHFAPIMHAASWSPHVQSDELGTHGVIVSLKVYSS